MSTYSNKHFRYKKPLKQKVFLSNELKRALLVAFNEAKKHKIYVTSELLLYGLLTQENSIAARLISTTMSQFKNNKALTSNLISNKIKELNNQKLEEKFRFEINKPNKFSSELWGENATTPWLSPEVKDILKTSIQFRLKSKNKINIVSTKYVLFELLNKELVRELLTNVIN